ncbi:MAG TPA: hypothetical protein VN842_01460, partial [Thermoplasmata archaeon]|nr:hypothetical protein [Thermoplasmata archaeon]
MSAARGLFGTPTLAPVLVALLLVSSMAATAVLAARGVVPVSRAALETSPSTHAVQLSQPSASGRPAVSACLRPVSEFPALWRGPWPPPAVAPTLQSPCAWGADESSLGFLSNQSGSADRSSFTVLLPPSGTATGETLAALSFRIWASGMPCSLDGATQVEVQLIPPASPYGSSFSADWSVRAPAFDLVPPSSCDPTCSNDTAIFTIDGAAFCEDQIVRSAPGAPPTAPTGAFSPGDTLELTFVGSPGGTSPLAIYLNDTTRPSVDLAFVYGATSMLTGRPLVPLFSDANLSESVWGLSPGIAAVATLCPVPDSAISSCLSYNESAMDATPSVSIESASFWNGTSGTYSSSYDAVATSSSTGACTIGPIECSGFSGPSGGFYPYWSLHNVSGNLAWQFGGSYPSELGAFDGPSAGEGIVPRWAPTITVANVAGSQGGGGVFVSGQVADPDGVARVIVNLDYCASPSTEAQGYQMVELGSALSSAVDGTFQVYFPSPEPLATYPFWVIAES